MKLMLVDDEELALEELSAALKKFSNINIIGKFQNPAQALEAIVTEKPDAVFLDIEMPQMNGFEIAEEIIKLGIPTSIVFATAYNQHAIKAFDINAIDYILKPFSENRLLETIERIRQKIITTNLQNDKYIKFIKTQNQNSCNSLVHVWANGRIMFLKPSEILYCTVEERDVVVVTQSKKYKTNGRLSDWEQKLGDTKVFRCHKSFLISLDKVEEIQPLFNSYIVKLRGINDEIPLSRNYVKEFKKRMGI